MATDEKAPQTKRIVRKGFTKSPNVNYKRFYAIKFAIDLDQQGMRAIVAFFNIGDATYYRIKNAENFIAYKQYIKSKKLKHGENVLPVDMPKGATGPKKVTATPPASKDIAEAARVLELAEGVLGQAYDLHKQAKAQPAPKKSWFGKEK
jgi:hypothetical protein